MQLHFESEMKTYRFSHSAAQGGQIYAHKANSKITLKESLRKALQKASEELRLIDTTIKIYDDIFFMFFFQRNTTSPAEAINKIQESIKGHAEWNKKYVYGHVNSLEKKQLKKEIEMNGYDYEKG